MLRNFNIEVPDEQVHLRRLHGAQIARSTISSACSTPRVRAKSITTVKTLCAAHVSCVQNS